MVGMGLGVVGLPDSVWEGTLNRRVYLNMAPYRLDSGRFTLSLFIIRRRGAPAGWVAVQRSAHQKYPRKCFKK